MILYTLIKVFNGMKNQISDNNYQTHCVKIRIIKVLKTLYMYET